MSPDPANQKATDDLADVKAKMREALDRKKKRSQGGDAADAPLREKAHGSEVHGGAAPKMHRRKAGPG
ncbi:MAG TPA: DUF5302 family protein [Nocardioides sp.]|jgi:hypothetical protein|nr:DUF5302 family protein [Nocardioides sp.]